MVAEEKEEEKKKRNQNKNKKARHATRQVTSGQRLHSTVFRPSDPEACCLHPALSKQQELSSAATEVRAAYQRHPV